ncbi:MAG: tRNA 2-selenouridine(34) synthase MnmH [Thiotrichaceae bacterium]
MKLHFEKDLPLIENLHDLFLNNTPLLDVRAPVEFSQGAFDYSENSPLLSDEERHEIGIRYKDKGQDEAINLAAELISDEIREKRTADWVNFISKYPESTLYCFRGGMRSKITQQWIYEKTGIKYPRVKGGYKAMRRFLIDNSERLIEETSFMLLGGSTGSGKTRLLKHVPKSLDLEGLANHRGSAFGANASPQPTQINFENTMSVQQLKHEQAGYKTLLLEDEGRNIGGVHLPILLNEKMAKSPIILLKISKEERLQTSMQEYAIDMLEDFQNHYGEEAGFQYFREALLNSLDRIQKRLGGERHKTLRKIAVDSLDQHEKTGSPESHISWVTSLLVDYYDPMYNYQLDQKKDRIVFTGNQDEVLEYFTSRS